MLIAQLSWRRESRGGVLSAFVRIAGGALQDLTFQSFGLRSDAHVPPGVMWSRRYYLASRVVETSDCGRLQNGKPICTCKKKNEFFATAVTEKFVDPRKRRRESTILKRASRGDHVQWELGSSGF